MFDIAPYETKLQQALAHFEEESKKIRTGRAHPSMLEGVMVEVYGAKLPLNQAANIVAVEPQLLQVTPFDQNNVKSIAAAIRDNQSLGFNPSDDGRMVRVPIPQLTTERRQQLVKQLSERVEDCRIALRNVRHDVLKDAKKAKDDRAISEDDLKRVEKSFDAAMASAQSRLEAIAKAKEAEIMTV